MSAPNRNNDHGVKRSQTQHVPTARSPPSGERPAPARCEEEQPIMRSVAISPATHHQRTLHFEPALGRVDPIGIAHLCTYRGANQPVLNAAKSLQKRSESSPSDSSLPRKWLVEDASLQTRPDDFPPLRTTRTVESTPAHVISARLSDCLQSRSIKTRFSKSEGHVVKCRNTDFCKFAIRLYSGEKGGVMVEVQRLCGDSISFMKDCRALLNAAEGKDDEAPADDEKPFYLRLPVSSMSFMKKPLPPITHEEEAESVNVTAGLLSSHMSDSNMLGMEGLVIQTDPLKTLKSTAIMASRRILCHDDPGNRKFNIHNYVMSLLIYGLEEESPLEAPEAEMPCLALEHHTIKLRNLAYSSLYNALSLFASENILQSTISSNQDWWSSVLIPRLVHELRTAAHQPHDACFASRCLLKLAECSVEFASVMRDSGGHDAVEEAESVGTREFALLVQDVGNFHKVLQCCV